MASSVTGSVAAVPLPPQLATALGGHASNVADMCFLAPGDPWSGELLNAMLADLRYSRELIAISNRGARESECISLCVPRWKIAGAREKRPRRQTPIQSARRPMQKCFRCSGLHRDRRLIVLGYVRWLSGANGRQTASIAGATANHATRATLGSAPQND